MRLNDIIASSSFIHYTVFYKGTLTIRPRLQITSNGRFGGGGGGVIILLYESGRYRWEGGGQKTTSIGRYL